MIAIQNHTSLLRYPIRTQITAGVVKKSSDPSAKPEDDPFLSRICGWSPLFRLAVAKDYHDRSEKVLCLPVPAPSSTREQAIQIKTTPTLKQGETHTHSFEPITHAKFIAIFGMPIVFGKFVFPFFLDRFSLCLSIFGEGYCRRAVDDFYGLWRHFSHNKLEQDNRGGSLARREEKCGIGKCQNSWKLMICGIVLAEYNGQQSGVATERDLREMNCFLVVRVGGGHTPL